MLFDLKGKTAVITGSSRGIGRAIAERMAEAGANVAISSRKAGPCAEAAAAINKAHGAGRAIAAPANISSKDDLAGLVAAARKAWGRIDILVCNAASNPYFGPIAGVSDEQFRKTLDNNILSTHWLVQMVAPEMAARRDGSIVIVSSIGAFRGSPSIGVYNITKAADIQLARNLAIELGPSNVRVNCIAPGLIRTDFSRALWQDEKTLKRMTEPVPLRRIGEADEVAGAAVYLASPAASFVTGATIVIDGGATVTTGF
jgi:NAD(P)-dependent dehydrogenase (short-subunit alcohol dehydrogenase family)